MQYRIDVIGSSGLTWMRGSPRYLECDEVRVAALGAGAVTVGKRNSFIHKEQLGIRAWRHDVPMTSAKFESAGDPAAHLPVTHDLAIGVVQDASVAHQCPSIWHGDDFTEGRDAVPQRMSRHLFQW
jgi:hypothetical protein